MRIVAVILILLLVSGCGGWKFGDWIGVRQGQPTPDADQSIDQQQTKEIDTYIVEPVRVQFTVITPDTAQAGEPFTVKVIAKDKNGVVLTNYDKIGTDVEIVTTGSGMIHPSSVKASEFVNGIATVDFVYDKTEAFDIIAKETQATERRKKHIQLKTGKKEAAKADEVQTERLTEYTIDKEDELDISVWGWQDLDEVVIVRPDGKISFPLAGDVRAEGLTLTELDNELTRRLKEYIREPEVSIMLKKFGGNKVIVLGEVYAPGVYKTTGRNSIMEVIALAEGFTEDACLSSVILVRGGLKYPKSRRTNTARLNLRNVIEKGDLSQNVSVQPEDLVYVPKKFIANVNYFLEEIISPALDKADFFKGWESTW
ncbi:MAG: polysaccharide biosynthesis/export family protein [Candidatus Omnitrophica bacterium]|nr:polysaccharide biosynthesis/export family protein [Candidatus Omnitrophota bacterium]